MCGHVPHLPPACSTASQVSINVPTCDTPPMPPVLFESRCMVRPVMYTVAPASPRPIAIPRPIPEAQEQSKHTRILRDRNVPREAPVTRAMEPARSGMRSGWGVRATCATRIDSSATKIATKIVPHPAMIPAVGSVDKFQWKMAECRPNKK